MNDIERNERQITRTFSHKQETALSALLTYPTIEEAAQEAGVSKTSIYKWLKEFYFQDELLRRRRRLISQALNGMAGLLDKAVRETGRLLEDEHITPQLRRLVCNDIIEFNLKASEIEDIKKRIEILEETVLGRILPNV